MEDLHTKITQNLILHIYITVPTTNCIAYYKNNLDLKYQEYHFQIPTYTF